MASRLVMCQILDVLNNSMAQMHKNLLNSQWLSMIETYSGDPAKLSSCLLEVDKQVTAKRRKWRRQRFTGLPANFGSHGRIYQTYSSFTKILVQAHRQLNSQVWCNNHTGSVLAFFIRNQTTNRWIHVKKKKKPTQEFFLSIKCPLRQAEFFITLQDRLKTWFG